MVGELLSVVLERDCLLAGICIGLERLDGWCQVYCEHLLVLE
jgi:hypothetical protein